MKRIITALSIFAHVILASHAQTPIVDFDTIPYQISAWNGSIEVIENPSFGGINTSVNAARYTTPANAAWGNCAIVDFENKVNYKHLDSIQFMVMAPSASLMFVKLEHNEIEGETQPSAYVTPVESAEWQTLTLNFSGMTGEDSIAAEFNRFALFFNVNDASGGEGWIFDNFIVYPPKAVIDVPVDTIEAPDPDLARIFKAMDKGRRGEDLTIGVIGGSITEGYAASTESKRWGNLMADWWENKFPESNIKFINAGWGGTGSDIGVHRVYDELLNQQPDYIVVEFAVNEAKGEHAEKMMEGLMQQILLAENNPGISILILKQSNGSTARDSHIKVAYHYEIPFVSFADLIDYKVQEDGLDINSIFVDGLHPNDVGMAYIGEMFEEHLDSIYARLPEEGNLPGINTRLPEPMIGDTYSNTAQYLSNDIDPLANSGWQISSNGWTTAEANNQIDFQLSGNAISLIYTKNDDSDRGRAEVWVDDGPVVIIDAYMNQDWGTMFAFSTIQEGLSDGQHTLHIKSIEASSTSGNKVNIARILCAGNIEDLTGTIQGHHNDQDWFSLYPNPATKALNLQFHNSETKDLSIRLLDLHGKCIWTKHIDNAPPGMNECKIELDQGTLAPGIYLFQMDDSKTIKTIKTLIH